MKSRLVFMITMQRKDQGWTWEAIDKERKRLFRTKISDLQTLYRSIVADEFLRRSI